MLLAELGDVLAVVLLRVVYKHVHALLGVVELRYECKEEVEEGRGVFDVQRHEHDRPRVALRRDSRKCKNCFCLLKKNTALFSHLRATKSSSWRNADIPLLESTSRRGSWSYC